MSRNTLARSTLVVSAAAASSRVLGFVRDVLLATILGTGPAADAFVVAFRLPGLTRRVLGEGVLNGGVIPVENRVRAEQGDDAARILAGETLATLALGLLVVVALAEIVAPVLVLALAAGYVDDPLRFGLATDYTRLMLPLIAATALTAVAGALLNAQGRVTVAAAAPVLVNGILVAVLLALRASEAPAERLGLWLSASVSVAGVAQLVVLMIAMRQMPNPPRLVRPRWSPEIRRMLALGVPGLLAVAAGQLSVIVATQVASQTPAGVARLYYADRLFQLPLGFVAAGAGVVLLPEIVRLLRAGDLERLAQAQNRSLEWAMLLALPAAVGLAVLSEPIVSVLFEHGEFGRMDVAETARALTALAPGLPLAAAIRRSHPAVSCTGKPANAAAGRAGGCGSHRVGRIRAGACLWRGGDRGGGDARRAGSRDRAPGRALAAGLVAARCPDPAANARHGAGQRGHGHRRRHGCALAGTHADGVGPAVRARFGIGCALYRRAGTLRRAGAAHRRRIVAGASRQGLNGSELPAGPCARRAWLP